MLQSGKCKLTHILRSLDPGLEVGGKEYFRLYRRMKSLERSGYITLERGKSDLEPGGEIPGLFVGPSDKLLYLMKRTQNSNRPQNDPGTTTDADQDPVERIPKKCHPARLDAIAELKSIGPGSFRVKGGSPEHPVYPLIEKRLKSIEGYFGEYTFDVNEKAILLGDGNGNVLELPYRNRFNDYGRKVRLLERFEEGFAEATRVHQVAVFLTLTTSGTAHRSLWTANRRFTGSWNRYLSLIQKRKKFRPQFVAAFEFTKSGLLHSHVAIFGISWLDPIEKIEEDWSRTGQGKIAHAYAIENVGGTWKWKDPKKQPRDARNRDPGDYMKKYVKKALYTNEGFKMYWSLNKRFYSMSRKFTPPPVRIPRSGIWIFIGSWKKDQIPPWVYDQSRRTRREVAVHWMNQWDEVKRSRRETALS